MTNYHRPLAPIGKNSEDLRQIKCEAKIVRLRGRPNSDLARFSISHRFFRRASLIVPVQDIGDGLRSPRLVNCEIGEGLAGSVAVEAMGEGVDGERFAALDSEGCALEICRYGSMACGWVGAEWSGTVE